MCLRLHMHDILWGLLLQWRLSLYVLKYWLGILKRQLLGLYLVKVRPLVRLAPKFYPVVICYIAGLTTTIANNLTSCCTLGLLKGSLLMKKQNKMSNGAKDDAKSMEVATHKAGHWSNLSRGQSSM